MIRFRSEPRFSSSFRCQSGRFHMQSTRRLSQVRNEANGSVQPTGVGVVFLDRDREVGDRIVEEVEKRSARYIPLRRRESRAIYLWRPAPLTRGETPIV